MVILAHIRKTGYDDAIASGKEKPALCFLNVTIPLATLQALSYVSGPMTTNSVNQGLGKQVQASSVVGVSGTSWGEIKDGLYKRQVQRVQLGGEQGWFQRQQVKARRVGSYRPLVLIPEDHTPETFKGLQVGQWIKLPGERASRFAGVTATKTVVIERTRRRGALSKLASYARTNKPTVKVPALAEGDSEMENALMWMSLGILTAAFIAFAVWCCMGMPRN